MHRCAELTESTVSKRKNKQLFRNPHFMKYEQSNNMKITGRSSQTVRDVHEAFQAETEARPRR